MSFLSPQRTSISSSNHLVISDRARIILKMLQDRVVSEPILSQANQFFDRAGKPLWSKDGVRTHQLPSFWGIATDIFRVFRAWSWAPRAISYAPPTMIGVVIGPGWIVLRLASVLGRRPETSDDRFQASVEEDIVFAIVGQLARYWKTNSLLLSMTPFIWVISLFYMYTDEPLQTLPGNRGRPSSSGVKDLRVYGRHDA